MEYKIKIVTGFGDDQKYTINATEAHKAYYLFRNPDKRGVFSNGLALIGRHIQAIQPDWNATMGWSPTHKLDDHDWREIKSSGAADKMERIMKHAENIGLMIDANPDLISRNLAEIPQQVVAAPSQTIEALAEKMKKI